MLSVEKKAVLHVETGKCIDFPLQVGSRIITFDDPKNEKSTNIIALACAKTVTNQCHKLNTLNEDTNTHLFLS